MLDFLRHIFKKHRFTALAILILILMFTAVPNEDILMLPHVDAKTALQVMNIGKLSFQGIGSGYLKLSGYYQNNKKSVFDIVINEEKGGIRSFKWSKNNGPYINNLLTDKPYKLSDGVIVKFDPTLTYQPGDNWTISTGLSSKINLASNIIEDTGNFIASLYSTRLNLAQKNDSDLLAVSRGARSSELALFDLNISPAGTSIKNSFWFLVPLAILVFLLVFWLIKKNKKKRLISKKILVVEDEPDMRQALGEVLKQAGFQIMEAVNGEDGLSLAMASKPDLILLDILMPKMDGIEMMKKIRRQDEWGRKVPIILLTNLSADEKIMQSIIQDEPIYYLVKSDWKISDVLEKVRQALKN